MIQLDFGQRWLNRRDSYRHSDNINPADYEVAPIDGDGSDTIAKAFVREHHYSGTYPAARERIGLYFRKTGKLVGIAVFSHPPSEDVLGKLPCDRLEGVELGRFVLLPSVPGNGETWFLARCHEILRPRGYRVLISHSDPVRRRKLDGTLVLPGHVGFIYQAGSMVYGGRSKRQLHVLKPDGTVFSPRSMTKIRLAESGYFRSIRELVDIGARAPTATELETRNGRRDWMWRSIEATCRRLEHGGNFRYLFALDKRLSRKVADLGVSHPVALGFAGPIGRMVYPKVIDQEPEARAA